MNKKDWIGKIVSEGLSDDDKTCLIYKILEFIENHKIRVIILRGGYETNIGETRIFTLPDENYIKSTHVTVKIFKDEAEYFSEIL